MVHLLDTGGRNISRNLCLETSLVGYRLQSSSGYSSSDDVRRRHGPEAIPGVAPGLLVEATDMC
jgi:hypothetical protein